MPVVVHEVRVPIEAEESQVYAMALGRAGLAESEVSRMEIVRRSLDRRRGLILSYTVELHLLDDSKPPSRLRHDPKIAWEAPAESVPLLRGVDPLEHRPVVIGGGPAGLFAALVLARAGMHPIVLERGDAMNHRATALRNWLRDGTFDPESHYLFGEGGAGTWSDGKLTSRSRDPRTRFVLEEFRVKSGIDAVTWHYRPHLGSDRVRTVVGRLRMEILALGGSFRFRCRAEGLNVVAGRVTSIRTSEGEIPSTVVVVAPGHSARDFVRTLAQDGLVMVRKPFQLGVRVEHPQGFIDNAVWGAASGHPKLGPADYRVATNGAGRSVFSFCMCPGGEVIPAVHDVGHMNTNGMSWSAKNTGFANSGLVTTLNPEDFPGEGVFAGMELQEQVEARAAVASDYSARVPAQRLVDFMAGRPSDSLPGGSCRHGMIPADLRPLVPAPVLKALLEAIPAFGRQIPGFLQPSAVVVGPEARSSSPVRLQRDPQTLEADGVRGAFPIGEGAGYAGGIVSAALDGVRVAEVILARYRQPSLSS